MEEYLARYSVVLHVTATSKKDAEAIGMTALTVLLPERTVSSIKFKECVKADIAYRKKAT